MRPMPSVLVPIKTPSTHKVKELFDSEYLHPQNNQRVLQDSHPKKQAAFQQALARYEKDLKVHSQVMQQLANFRTEEMQQYKEET